ncbi:MAG: alpha/beta hydrolase fold domain-containing protein [Planctomycetota bacterium]
MKQYSLSFLLTVIVASISSGQATQSQEGNQPPRWVQKMFQRQDKDSDGSITRDEAKNQLKRNFDRVDADKNGLVSIREFRTALQSLKKPPANVPVPDNVELKKDIAYREGHDLWKLDLAMPKAKSNTPRPALVVIHGGGWHNGDKAEGQWRRLPLEYASEGYVCISVNYRLLSDKKTTLADCIADCKCAVRWLRANAKTYNVNPNRIGAFGNSAGAHLVATLGLATKDRKMEGDGPHQEHSSMVQAVCCVATPTDFTDWGGDQSKGNYWQNRLLGKLDRDEWLTKVSPVYLASKKAPPFLIIHGTKDTTVPVSQGRRLNQSLKEKGAKNVTYLEYEGAGHGVFGQRASETAPAMKAFFRRTLGVTVKD